jgi:hypothetical protein
MRPDLTPKRSLSPPLPRPYGFLGLLYAGTAFAGTFVFFAAFIVFLGNLPKKGAPWMVPSADVGAGQGQAVSLLWNAALIFLFCLKHSLMARTRVKRMLAAVIPAELERATYVHAANLTGLLSSLFGSRCRSLCGISTASG